MTNKILLAAAVAAFTLTSFASQPLLSPRAAGNQPKVASTAETPAVTIAYADSASGQLSPRASVNQIKHVAGIASDTNPAAVCRANMDGSPKAVTECSSHMTMPGCAKAVAMQ
jgi:hypothetical protein